MCHKQGEKPALYNTPVVSLYFTDQISTSWHDRIKTRNFNFILRLGLGRLRKHN